MMIQTCPISLQQIDSNFVRLIATQVSLVALLFFLTHNIVFIFLLLLDFSSRAIKKPKFSPFVFMAKGLITLLKMKPKLTNEAPKRFALYLGLVMTSLILILSFLGFIKFALILTLFLIFAALLEAVGNYCIGCKVYYVLKYLNIIQ
jgi:hypothetical protein